jgi:hypothetical protein
MTTDCSGRAVHDVGLRTNARWDYGFESHRGYGCLSLVNVVCQVENCVSLRHTERGVSECVHEASTTKRPWPTGKTIKKSSYLLSSSNPLKIFYFTFKFSVF